MPTNKTPHYSLSQWERDDRILMEDFNADNAKIDTALAAEAKARAAADSTINTTLSAHSAALSRLGNCQIYTTSYVGNGKHGSDNPITLTFPHKPLLIAVQSATEADLYIILRDCKINHYLGGSNYVLSTTWNGNTVSWYGDHSLAQMNKSGTTYHLVALLAMD